MAASSGGSLVSFFTLGIIGIFLVLAIVFGIEIIKWMRRH